MTLKRGMIWMSDHKINIEFNSNLDEYKELIEKLYEQTLALKETSEEVDGFEVRFELKEHEVEEKLIYDQDEAIEFIQKALKGMNKQYINRGFLVAVLDAEEDYMRSKGIIEDEGD